MGTIHQCNSPIVEKCGPAPKSDRARIAMADSGANRGAKKRKQSTPDAAKASKLESKKARQGETPATGPQQQQQQQQGAANNLLEPHVDAISELQSTYDVLAAAIISSSQISKRVVYVTNHLAAASGEPPAPARARVALLHSRPADVCKLITVVEQCKRVLKEEGKAWHQYNQLFELPPPTKKADQVDETVLPNDDEQESTDDDFEVMQSRIEKAVLPPTRTRKTQSMRIVLSCTPVPELRAKAGVTVQSSETSTTRQTS